MKYRAYWKSTWYECEDYGALCRCLAWVGANSFRTSIPIMDINFWDEQIFDGVVYIEKVEDGHSCYLQCFNPDSTKE